MVSAVWVVKRAHKTLTIDQKLELLDQIGKKSYTVLCEEYGIGRSTISDIKKMEQDEASAYNLSMLRDLRELAAKKRLTSITQKKR